jgi:predicted deacylase
VRPLQRFLMATLGATRTALALALLLFAGSAPAQDFPPDSLAPPLAPPPPAPAPVPPPAEPAQPASTADGAAPAAAGTGFDPAPAPATDAGTDTPAATAVDAVPAPPVDPAGAGLGALRTPDAAGAAAQAATADIDPTDGSGPTPDPPVVADPFAAPDPADSAGATTGAAASGTVASDPAPPSVPAGEGADPMPPVPGGANLDAGALVPGIPDLGGVDPAQPLPSDDLMGPPAPDPDANEFGASPIALLGARVVPGSRERLRWTTGQSFSGSVMETPVIVIHGERPGPRLCLVAGVHGDELNGVETVRRLAYAIEPKDLAGTVIAVPIVNLLGFSRGSRYLPDRRDLNRFFPGNAGGSSASRIAHSFFAAVVDHCDALVDFHTGSFDRANLPQVRADLRIPAVVEFTRGFGATAVLHSPGSAGMLRLAASRHGIPAVTFEIGAPLRLQPEEIEHGVEAIQSLMHQMNMVATRRRWTEPQAVFYESRWVRVDQGGMLFSELALGDRVEQGDLLGRVIDPVSNRSNEVRAPEAGRVIGMALNQLVLPGFAAYHLGVASSEEQVVIDAAQEAGPYDERFLEYDQLDGTRAGGPDELEEPAEATSDEAADAAEERDLEDG